ncbi:beta-propeller fold lactonase family protein, partial [candidate division KSB1 bacterium]
GFGEVAVFSRHDTTGKLTYVEYHRDGMDTGGGMVDGILTAGGAAVSPDGKNLYVTGTNDAAIAVFTRDPVSSSLTFLEHITDTDIGGTGLTGSWDVKVSPDGAHVYVTGRDDDAITLFSRDQSDGSLTFIEALTDGGTDGAGNTVNGILSSYDLAVSPDGKNVYVTGGSDDAVAVFTRNPATGRLTYIEMFQDPSSGGGEEGLDFVKGVAVSPDGNHVYTAAKNDNSVVVFSRNQTDGSLTYVEQLIDAGTDGDGNTIDGLVWVNDVVVSPGGGFVYAAGTDDKSITVFKRDKADGTLTFMQTNIDATVDGFGNTIDGLNYPERLDWSPDGKHLFASSQGNEIAVFKRVTAPLFTLTIDTLLFNTIQTGLSDTLNFWIYNDGADTMFVDSIINFSSEFSIEPYDSTGTIGEDSLLINVVFLPAADSTYYDSLFIYSNDTLISPFVVQLKGTGYTAPVISLEFDTLLFDTVLTGYTDTLFTYLYNTGSDSLFIDSVLASPEFYAFTTDTPGVAIGDSVLYSIVFNPHADSTYSDSIAFFSNDVMNSPLYLQVKGAGSPAARLVLTQYDYNFGGAAVGDSILGGIIRVENVGGDTASVTNITPTGPFEIVSATFPDTVLPDTSVSYIVRFLPLSAGEFNGTITVATSDSIDPDPVFTVSGTGLSPTSGTLNFVQFKAQGIDGVTGMNGATCVEVTPDGSGVYVGSYLANAVAVFGSDPAADTLIFVQQQLKGSDTGGGLVDKMGGVKCLAISPDGKHVYVGAWDDYAVVIFSRDPATNELTYLGYKQDPSMGGSSEGLSATAGITVSPDGAHVYATGFYDNELVVFSRDPETGALTWVEYQRNTEDHGGGVVSNMAAAHDVVVSPDGKHVYVAGAGNDAVVEFSRNPATGKLTFVGSITQTDIGGTGLDDNRYLTISHDGKHVYSASSIDDAVTVLSRNSTTGVLTFVEYRKHGVDNGGGMVDGLDTPYGLAVSRDGNYLYVITNTSNALTVFKRNPSTGSLTYIETHVDGTNGIDGLGTSDYQGLAVSPDGINVYGTGYNDDAITVFKTGASALLTLTQSEAHFGATIVGDTAIAAFVTIFNSGGDSGYVTDVTPTGPFEIVNPVFPDTVLPDSAVSYIVRFVPQNTGGFNGTLDFTTTDSIHTHLIFDVSGIGTQPKEGSLNFVNYVKDDSAGVNGIMGAFYVKVSPDDKNVYAVGMNEDGLAVFTRSDTTGALSFVEAHFDGTADVDGLNYPQGMAISPDGKNVYVCGMSDLALAVFNRNVTTGALTYAGMVQDGVNGVDGLDGAYHVDVSPDGAHVYATAYNEHKVSIFNRNSSTGSLTFVGYIEDNINSVDGIQGASDVKVSPDGKHVYVSGYDEAKLGVFRRNINTGELTFVEAETDGSGGVTDMAGTWGISISPDGKHLYVAAETDHGLTAFSRDPSTGVLTFIDTEVDGAGGVEGLGGARYAFISPDGDFVYATGEDDTAIAIFNRDHISGLLTFEEYVQGGGAVNGLTGLNTLALTKDGRNIYTAGSTDNSIAVFKVKAAADTGILVIDPEPYMDYGYLTPGTPDTLMRLLLNSGGDTLFVDSLAIMNGLAFKFTTISDTLYDTLLGLNDYFDTSYVEIEFNPPAVEEYSDSVFIRYRSKSASGLTQFIEYIELHGYGQNTGGELSMVQPGEGVYFGDVVTGNTVNIPVRIKNVGADSVFIDTIYLAVNNPEFWFNPGITPIMLQDTIYSVNSGMPDSLVFGIDFNPPSIQDYIDTLVVIYDRKDGALLYKDTMIAEVHGHGQSSGGELVVDPYPDLNFGP